MPINPVQQNTDIKFPEYRNKKGAIKTNGNVQPETPKGHLVHDTLVSVPKFWLKDIAYDLKAVKDGFKGNTNDHQQGRLNDVGLKLGGIGIAAYLASRTTDPKLRLLEYVGLGSFLAAMSIYPKIAINAPSRLVHGFDIGKEYIDDQGRKKSVFQDSNYIPFDMYKGDYPGEDLDIIGDRMGIPRDIKNRHDLIKEQMRKIATQNNTLWMLTAGFATPVMAALTGIGIEKMILPAVDIIRNSSNNKEIAKLLKTTTEMVTDPAVIEDNKLGKQIGSILNKYKGAELPQKELDKIISIISNETEAQVASGIKEDLNRLFNSEPKFAIGNTKDLINNIKSSLTARNRANLEKIFVLSEEEFNGIINKLGCNSQELTEKEIRNIKEELRKFFTSKIENSTEIVNKEFYKDYQNRVLDNISKNIKTNSVIKINESNIKKAVDFANIIGEFKQNEHLIDKCLSKKFEEAPQTVLARSYEKFENTLFKVLDIKYKDLKKMKESEKYTKEILEQKLKALAQNETKYNEAIKKLTDVMSKMEIDLNGKFGDKSHILDLIHTLENNYNKTAQRLDLLGSETFATTINRLVKEDLHKEVKGIKPLETIVKDREELFKLLDGTIEPSKAMKKAAGWKLEYGEIFGKGIGSAKNNAITRIVNRYQGVKNSFNRILLSLDLYKREIPNSEYGKQVTEMAKEALLHGNSSQFTQKLKTTNNPELFRDIMFSLFNGENLNASTLDALGLTKEDLHKAISDTVKKERLETGNVNYRFIEYLKRFKEAIGSNMTDFTKPNHRTLGGDAVDSINSIYRPSSTTPRAYFDLVAQDPVNMIKGSAARKYGNKYWLRKASIIGASVLGLTILAQFAFGKIKNPQNIQKQVSDGTNA